MTKTELDVLEAVRRDRVDYWLAAGCAATADYVRRVTVADVVSRSSSWTRLLEMHRQGDVAAMAKHWDVTGMA